MYYIYILYIIFYILLIVMLVRLSWESALTVTNASNKVYSFVFDFRFQVSTFVFVLEMLIKLTALSPRGYVQSRWNLLDGFLVVVSVVDLGIVLCVPRVTQGVGFSVLRTFRLVRTLYTRRSA